MEQLIQDYRNLIQLSNSFLNSENSKSFLEELMWIERMLDRGKVIVGGFVVSDEDHEASQAFTKEVYQHLDHVLRPKIGEIALAMNEGDKAGITSELKSDSEEMIKWANIT